MVNNRYDYSWKETELIQFLTAYLEENSMVQSCSALPFAVKMHEGQTRKEGAPYIIHPVTMALHAISLGIKEDAIIATILLHDVCEDCPVAYGELPVNKEVQFAVECITCKRETGEEKKHALERYYANIRKSREASITKLFDRCHNISTMSKAFSPAKITTYIEETKTYVYPLMEYVKKQYPEFGHVVYVLEYQMRSVLESVSRFAL